MMKDRFSLEGKTALVATSSALGRAAALALAQAGADVALAARHSQLLEDAAHQVTTLGRRALALTTEGTDSEQVRHAVDTVLSQWGQVDILVNHAEMVPGERSKPLWEISDEEWREGIDAALTSAFYFCRAVGKGMMERRHGKVINIANLLGLKARRGQYIDCAARGGLLLFTQTMAITWAREGLNVNAIAHGLFDILPEGASPEEHEFLDIMAPLVPIGRAAKPQEIGPLVVFLASEASSYITGAVFIIDGAGLAAGFAPTGYAPIISLAGYERRETL